MNIWNRLVESGLLNHSLSVGAKLEPLSEPSSVRRHQFVILLKPELLDSSMNVDVPGAFHVVMERLGKEDLTLGGVRWFTGGELRRSGVMERHYGVINEVSRRGLDALSEAQRARFNDFFGSYDEAQVFGAHAYLESHPQATSDLLKGAFQLADVIKVAPGIYAASTVMPDGEIVLLNGFHPAQLHHFTSQNARLVAFEYRSSKPWAYLRNHLAGGTDPRAAAEGSLRYELFKQSAELQLPEMSVNSNGVHLSAGPVEGCAEVVRFFDSVDCEVPVASTVLGSELIRAGASRSVVDGALRNELVFGGESAFDASEEMDIDDAIRLITGAS